MRPYLGPPWTDSHPIWQWRSEDVRGPWTTLSPGPLPILHNLISLTPPPQTPLLILCTCLSLLYGFIRNFLIGTHLMVYFGNLGPFDDAMGEIGQFLWWRNDKWDPLITWWDSSGHNWGPLDEAIINWDTLITWWEIRGQHFDDIMRKLGILMAHRKIKGPLPFDDAMRKLESLYKVIGKLWGAKWPNEENRKLGLWWRNGTSIWGAPLMVHNVQIVRDPSDDEIGGPLMTWRGNWGP